MHCERGPLSALESLHINALCSTHLSSHVLTLYFAKVLEAVPYDFTHKIDWDSLPELVHPLGGELPQDRLEKKCQQLENLASAVLSIAQPGQVLVDFCSGGGHLAILLAYLLPQVTVYLVENKQQSLLRAIKRVQALGLENCRFYQGNMDYFQGRFDIGVSLHACGVATDLVIQSCIRNRASFVSCPCCYGSVQANHMLGYPRSRAFQDIAFKVRKIIDKDWSVTLLHDGISR